MGMFSMFYGLPGELLAEFSRAAPQSRPDGPRPRRRPTSSTCTRAPSSHFPSWTRTVFARVARPLLHEGKAPERWRRDRENLDAIFAAIDQRDLSKPFFTFMFFESPHAPYTFPPECALTKPYVADLNYLTMDLKKDIGAIKNSYINACRHLDTQLDRVFVYLREKKLLDSTLVVVTGDHGRRVHGEGPLGHHSAFSEEADPRPADPPRPGVTPRVVDRMTSHLDLPATVLPRLGVTNPPADYSLGSDLIAGPPREWLLVSGWTEVVYVDDAYKAIFPVKSYTMTRQQVSTRDDAPSDKSVFLGACRDRVTQMMKDLRRFQ